MQERPHRIASGGVFQAAVYLGSGYFGVLVVAELPLALAAALPLAPAFIEALLGAAAAALSMAPLLIFSLRLAAVFAVWIPLPPSCDAGTVALLVPACAPKAASAGVLPIFELLLEVLATVPLGAFEIAD